MNTTLADSAVEVELAEMRARQDRRIAAAQAETALCEAETARIRADMAARKLANAERLRQRRLWDAADRLREGYVTFGVALPPEALR